MPDSVRGIHTFETHLLLEHVLWMNDQGCVQRMQDLLPMVEASPPNGRSCRRLSPDLASLTQQRLGQWC